jgi:ribonucleoside-diphosphate reductase alpha chain
MGLHEWLIQRGYKYEMVDELKKWFAVYRSCSRGTADRFSSQLDISNPVACRAIAPTGSIGIIAGTTTGIEPIYAVAIKRRYLKGTTWKYQYVIDGAAKDLIDRYAVNPEKLESSIDLAKDYERRIKFQADVQDYVDMSISSTINLPKWDTEYNHEGLVKDFANTLASYVHRLRGFTVYPDGARGGQPLVSVPYHEAIDRIGVELEENTEVFDVCDITGTGFCSA